MTRWKYESYFILFFAFINHVIMFGITWSSGVFYEMFLHVGGYASKGEVALISALNTAMFYAAGPMSAIFSNLFGNRKVALAGAICSSLGLLISCVAPNALFLYFSFGILNGVGLGLVYMPTVSTVIERFSKYQTFALGVATSGSAIGLMAFPPLVSFMASEYGWQGALLITGAISCNLFACSLALRPLCPKKVSCSCLDPRNNEKKEEVLNMGVLKNCNYVILCVNNVFLMLGISVLFVHLSAYATSLGHDPQKGSLLFSMMGLTGFVGRILYGLLAQTVRPICLYTVGFLLSGIVTVLCPVFDSYVGLLVYAAFYGLFSSCLGTIMPFVVTEMLDISLLNSGYGYLMLFEGVGMVAGGPLAAWLYEVTRHYPSSIYMGGGAIVVSSLIMILPWVQMRKPSIETSTVFQQVAVDCKPPLHLKEYISSI